MTEIDKEIEEMAENILTCPFCGGKPLMETFSVRKGYEANIHCDKCLASISTITYDTEGEAILNCLKNWNSRIGYRKESEEEINKIIITAKRKLYDANLESINLIMGEREKDIKQAWQNGYNKAREEVVKQFAEKVNEVIEACERQDGYDAEGSPIYTIDTAILRVEMEQIAEQYGKENR